MPIRHPRLRHRWLGLCQSPKLLGGFLCVGALLMSGCGADPNAKSTGKVSGVVTFQGKPVADGVVYFSSKSGVGANAPLAAEGKFAIPDAVEVGDYTVTVTPPPPPPPRPEDGPPKPTPAAADIPQKYRSEQTTDLKATVKTGDNAFEFDLKP